MTAYQLPCRPFSVIDAINRCAAATGSCRYAMLAADADYNGHYVTVSFNDYRGYWVAEYTWSGRNVLCRGELRECLLAAQREYDRGAKGAQVMVTPRTLEDEALCRELGYQPCTDARPAAYQLPEWYTELHREVGTAMRLEQQVGIPATSFLAQATDLADYRARVDAYVAEQRRPRVGA